MYLALSCVLLTLTINVVFSFPANEHAAIIQAIPPNVSMAPLGDKTSSGGNFVHINPFLTNSLLQALIEDSEHKKRVQRYREVA